MNELKATFVLIKTFDWTQSVVGSHFNSCVRFADKRREVGVLLLVADDICDVAGRTTQFANRELECKINDTE